MVKRREFLRGFAAMAGGLLPVLSRAQQKPCPPGSVSALGGSSASIVCPAVGGEDWVRRSTGPGVVWAHRFETAAEVTNFLSTRTDPSVVRWTGADGASTPGCLECVCPTGGPYLHIASISRGAITTVATDEPHKLVTGDPVSFVNMENSAGWSSLNRYLGYTAPAATVTGTNTFTVPINTSTFPAYSSSPGGHAQRYVNGTGIWRRPYSALLAGGNGLASDDPAASGTLTRRTWNPTSPSRHSGWEYDYYGNSLYHTQTTPSQAGNPTPTWSGTEHYIQFRYKIPFTRMWTPFQPDGKLAFIEYCSGNQDGELVLQSKPHYVTMRDAVPPYSPAQFWYADDGSRTVTAPWGMYGSKTTFTRLSTPLQPRSGGTPNYMPNADAPHATSCTYGATGVNSCWWMPTDEWITVLLHVVPGRYNSAATEFMNTAAYKDTGIEVWVARAGQSNYTKIFSVLDDGSNTKGFAWGWGQSPLYGWNAIGFGPYMNEVPAVEEFYQRYDEVIFSRQFIPCPAA